MRNSRFFWWNCGLLAFIEDRHFEQPHTSRPHEASTSNRLLFDYGLVTPRTDGVTSIALTQRDQAYPHLLRTSPGRHRLVKARKPVPLNYPVGLAKPHGAELQGNVLRSVYCMLSSAGFHIWWNKEGSKLMLVRML